MQTTIIQAATPLELKTAIDAIIAGGRTIVQVVEMSSKTFYVAIHIPT
jgi:hypothetical protein